MVLRICLVTFLLVMGSACATRGFEFESDTTWIEPETTRKEDVKKKLGDPYEVDYTDGKPSWLYGFYEFWIIGDSHQKELRLNWNRDGTLADFSFKSTFPEDKKKQTKKRERGDEDES